MVHRSASTGVEELPSEVSERAKRALGNRQLHCVPHQYIFRVHLCVYSSVRTDQFHILSNFRIRTVDPVHNLRTVPEGGKDCVRRRVPRAVGRRYWRGIDIFNGELCRVRCHLLMVHRNISASRCCLY